ncbi:MAG: hypothetical protein ACSLFF_02335 [Solirubrobacterales bacterium]
MMKALGSIALFVLAMLLLPVGASATVVTANGVREDSAFTKTGQVYAEGPTGLGKYVWYVDQTEDEAILRGYDQDDPTNLAQLAVVDGTSGVGLGRIGAVGGIAFLPASNQLFVLDRAKDRLVSYPRSNDGSADDPVDYTEARTRSHSDDDPYWFDLKDPNGLAVDSSGSGRIYISDTGHRRILQLDSSLTWFRKLTQPWWSPSTRPGAMSVDNRTGKVFVSIEGGERIEVFKRDLAGSEPTLRAPSSGDFIALSAEPKSNRLFAAKKNEINVFSLSTGTLLGAVGGFPFNNQISGISAVENLRDFHLASQGDDHVQSYFTVPPPECAAPTAPLVVAVGATATFTPDCDDTDHSVLQEFSIENSPALGTAELVNARSAIAYTAGATAGADVVKYKVMTQDGLGSEESYPINVVENPTAVVNAPTEGSTVGSPVTATFDVSNASSVTCTWDSEEPVDDCASPVGPKTLDAGDHSFTVTASNTVGGSASVTRSFTVIDPPTVSITAPSSGEEVGSPVTSSFTLGGGSASSVTCQWDDEPETDSCVSPQGPMALSAGSHSFTVTASNVAGNASATSSFEVVPEPVISIDTPTEGEELGSPVTASFTLDGGAADTVECQWDDEPVVSPCSGEQGPKELEPGDHSFTVTASNVAGSASVTRSFAIVEPPVILIIAPSNVQVVGSPATATFTLAGGTPESVSCQWDDEPVITPCSSPQGPKTLSPGIHTFTVTAVNVAEAVSVTSSFSIAPPVQAAAAKGPVVRETSSLQLESGDVYVKIPGGNEFEKLTEDKLIPIGTLIDSTDGKAHLTLANEDKSLYGGAFWGGVFQVKQGSGAKPIATMKLRSGFGVKGGAPGTEGARTSANSTAGLEGGETASIARRRGKKKGGLWGDGKGRFRTSGSGGSATVRGTRWYVADYENGTLFKVSRGSVTITPIHCKPFRLKAGKSHFIFLENKNKKKKAKRKNPLKRNC